MGAYYTIAGEDGYCTPITVKSNKGCSITVNITVNRYLIDIQMFSRIAAKLANSKHFGPVMGMCAAGIL